MCEKRIQSVRCMRRRFGSGARGAEGGRLHGIDTTCEGLDARAWAVLHLSLSTGRYYMRGQAHADSGSLVGAPEVTHRRAVLVAVRPIRHRPGILQIRNIFEAVSVA
ncbi:hypothetical protein PsYK624_011410 [Phanerochaete sordida]|uniref:Uncharacterized protein n=1 Tax=Phanerochaete sordida TaxID=48140 RepID=A0A9P3FZB5_9APHY|nr:hypothetical protein PsYK624_011410 [Phanerochaete sordida]